MDLHNAKDYAGMVQLEHLLIIQNVTYFICNLYGMQEVVRGLYLGPYSAASRSKLQTLLDCGITHIVCVRQNIEAHFIKPNFPDKFK